MPQSARLSKSPIARSLTTPLSALAAASLLVCAGAAQAQLDPSALLVAEPGGATVATGESDSAIARVIVQFNEAPVSRMRPNMSVLRANRFEMLAYSQQLRNLKAPRLTAIRQLGGRVQNTLEYVLNGAVVDMPRNRIATLQRMPGVKSVRLAQVYQMGQSAPRTVGELITTAQLNNLGNKGQGVAIAILDSGVDYTHAAFGGPGTTAVYATNVAGANPTTLGAHNAGLFPNGPRVKGGYDWLGDTWSGSAANPGGLLVTPDPNPIDNKQLASDFAGHGTNSASAAAGGAVPSSLLRAGSAPEAFVLAYRGCSRISRSCEGSALLNSVESVIQYAAGNPNANQPGANNPPLPAGTRFVLNMSLGATSGNPLIDDLAEASRNAVRAGVTVVASAGNSNDVPFVVGTPSGADQVISVAASQPELVTGPSLTVGAPLNQSYPLGTAAFGGTLAGPVSRALAFAGLNNVVGNNTNIGCSTVDGSDPANPGPPIAPIPALSGAAGMVDRGSCGFSQKAINVQRAGGSIALVVNNNLADPGPPGMAAGAPAPLVTIPVLSIGTFEGRAVKDALSANPTLSGLFSPLGDAANIIAGINVVDQLSGFTSRGPTQNLNALKPDITAPGSTIFMAAVGTGNQGVNNSGTSFSSPLTAGAAALVLAARPNFTPWQVKAALMNTANPTVFTVKSTNTLAGVTLMGAGRLDTQRAANTQTLAFDSEDVDPGAATFYNASLSFGPQAFTAAGATSVSRTVTVQNLGNAAKTYAIAVTPRFANDTTKGIVWSTSASSLTVPANSTGTFQVTATATGSALPTSGGFPVKLQQTDTCSNADGTRNATCTSKFNDVEQDGFVTIDGGDDANRVALPYLMYPRQASQIAALRIGASVTLRNTGVANSSVDVFNLVGTQDPAELGPVVAGAEELPVDIKAVGLRYLVNGFTGTLPAGITSRDLLQFAVTLHKPLDLLRLATMNIELDTNNDGVTDFTVRNLTTTTNVQTAFISTGTTGAPGNAFFNVFAPVNTSRMVLTVFTSPMNITANTRIGVRVRATNGFATGVTLPTVDRIPDAFTFQYITPAAPVIVPSALAVNVAGGGAARVGFTTNIANQAASPGDKGLLMIHNENPTASDNTTLQLVP